MAIFILSITEHAQEQSAKRFFRKKKRVNTKKEQHTMNDGRNMFIWLLAMVIIFVLLAVLETVLHVPDI